MWNEDIDNEGNQRGINGIIEIWQSKKCIRGQWQSIDQEAIDGIIDKTLLIDIIDINEVMTKCNESVMTIMKWKWWY